MEKCIRIDKKLSLISNDDLILIRDSLRFTFNVLDKKIEITGILNEIEYEMNFRKMCGVVII